ncbi:MAG: copper amine oxidase N-terminal domain-containing protein [Bacillaceae bacterium]|nr:copper amine oxidase N-terminal domain-containing protein [Bacillaceae bacterium]
MKRLYVPFFLLLFLIQTVSISAEELIKVYVDGEQLHMDATPSLKEGTTLVPVRAVSEGLGLKVSWDSDTRSVFIFGKNTSIAMSIGQSVANVNGMNIKMSRAPEIIHSRTYVPIRFISEAIGASVEWNGVNREIYITKNEMQFIPTRINEDGNPINQIDLPTDIFSK